jgi:hypothetical protein
MKKQHVDHVLRAAGRITGEKQPAGDTEGVTGLCLDPHDLAIAKYVARREKDIVFTRELATRGIVSQDRLLTLLGQTPVSEEARERIRTHINQDFGI